MARMLMETTLFGVRKRDGGEFEGRKYSSATTVYVEDTFGEDRDDVLGTCFVGYKIGESSEFSRFEKFVFPCRVRLDMESQADGKGGSRLIVKGVTPIDALPASKKLA